MLKTLVCTMLVCVFVIPGLAVDKIQRTDEYIERVSKRYGIPGIGLAVIKDGKVIHRKDYGYANLEHQVPVTNKSIFRLYSTTKLFVAVAIFKLLEEKKLSLDDSVSKYVDGLPKGWESRQIKHLLTHSSGLPNMAPIPDFEGLNEEQSVAKVIKKPIESEPGTKYSYNQTNFWILRKIITKASGKPFEEFVLDGQTNGKQRGAFFSTDSRDIILNRATAYFPFESGRIQIDHPHVGEFLSAANGLNMTVEEMIKWDARFVKRELVNDETIKKMWTSFEYKQPKEFGYGWEIQRHGKSKSYGFTGSLVTAYRHFPDQNMSIILFGNGMGQFFSIYNIVDYVAGIFEPSLMNPALEGSERLIVGVLEGNLDATIESFEEIKRKAPQASFEGTINSLGYALINSNRIDDAIKLFELNTREYPKSSNVWDSLGEGHFIAKRYEIALKYYKKSLELDPESKNGKMMVERIEALIKKK